MKKVAGSTAKAVGSLRGQKQRELLQSVFDRFSREVEVLSEKLDTALDIRERPVAFEARLPRVQEPYCSALRKWST